MPKNSLSRNILQNSIGTIFYLFCQWLTTVLIVKIVNYEAAGILSLAMSVTNTFATVSAYGMRQFQVSDYYEKYSSSQYVTSRYITSLLSMLFCLLFSMIGGYNSYQILCINIFMVFKITEALVDVYHGLDQKVWRFDVICNSFLIRGFLTLIAYSVVLIITHNLLFSILSMALVAFLCIVLYDIPQSKKLVAFKFSYRDKAAISKLLLECLPLVIVNFIASSIALIPRNTLSQIFGDKSLGIYASVATPAVIVQVLASVIFNPLIPLFSKYDAENDIAAFRKLLFKTIMLIAGIAILSNVVAFLLGKPILVLLFGESIEQYIYLLLPIVWCTIFTAIIWLFMCILTALRKVKSLSLSMIVGVIVCILSSNILVNKYNMNGVSFTVLLSLGIQIIFISVVIAVYIYKRSNTDRIDN